MDKLFRVEVVSKTPNPQQTIWTAMHQDYAEGFAFDDVRPSESESGELIIKHLLNGGRGHFGPIEHPQIVFNAGWFPHSVMQQIRTHRVGISMDVQSGRYSGQRVCQLVDDLYSFDNIKASDVAAVQEVFYFRPLGEYTDRSGNRYEYTEEALDEDMTEAFQAACRYKSKINTGFSEEHARDMLPFCIRQHWVLSCNARSLMHLLDLRAKADAQVECQWLCDLLWPHFEEWVPEVAAWYRKNRWGKARLAP
jgi:thymidylate synthase (FAD)